MMEVCSYMTWVRLNAELLSLTGDARFAERIERILCNQMLASSSGDGTSVGDHLTSTIKPAFADGYRGTTGGCCLYSHGMALEELPRIAGGVLERALVVNLFLPGRIAATTTVGPGAVTISGDLTVDGACTITTPEAQVSDLLIRIPTWLEKTQVQRKGSTVDPPRERGYWHFPGPFTAGETIRIAGELPLRIESLPWRLKGDSKPKEQTPASTSNGGFTNPEVNGGYIRRGPVVYGVLIRSDAMSLKKDEKPSWEKIDAATPYELPATPTLDAVPTKEELPYAGPLFTWKTAAGDATLVPYWQVARSNSKNGVRVLLRRAGAIPVTVPQPVLIPAGGRGPLEVRAVVIKGEELAGATLTYTLDGSDPTPTSTPWPGEVKVAPGKVLKARWFHAGNGSAVTTVSPLP
jgi:hypothetical protein